MTESRIDWRMIGALEGNALDGYVPSRGGVPLGASGVTIGMGCDLGALDRKALDALDLPQPLAAVLSPYLGRKAPRRRPRSRPRRSTSRPRMSIGSMPRFSRRRSTRCAGRMTRPPEPAA